ncbi:MAG TPA: YpdA family putative bacillithiol disulfide reductase [Vicinamibacterales bacterium]|nr:YpdA family putative bacillithiol disulfide reductase [Vicinamibacterales bacterium]
MSVRDLLIIGAGPAGLAVAIAASEAQLDYDVIEKGVLVNSIFNFPPGMTFFTTPDLLEIGRLPFVTPYEKPTRHEALRYYRRVVDAYKLQITFGEEVRSIGRDLDDGEPVFIIDSTTDRGEPRLRTARAVVFAIGYYDHPNVLGIPGETLPHVRHYYGDPHAHYRQHVLIVGGKNSAAIASLELYRAGAHVTLVHRGATLSDRIKYWIRPDIDNRIKEGSVAAHFESRVVEIRATSAVVEKPGGDRLEVPADTVLLLTGYHPDFNLIEAAGVTLGARREPIFNPETMETNVQGLFVAGGLVGGLDTGAIFIENGRFHGEKIVRTIQQKLALSRSL